MNLANRTTDPERQRKTLPNPQPSGLGLKALLAQPIMGCMLLAAITLLAYWPVQTCDFIALDDQVFIIRNYHVRAGLTWQGVLWALGARTGALWQPLTNLSYQLDAELFGKDLTGPHIINLLLHVGNAVLLLLVLRETTNSHWRSLLVAALFALHPLHVESVAWLSERKDVLSTFFGLLTLWAYAKYALSAKARASDRPPALDPGPRSSATPAFITSIHSARYYTLALICFVLGLMSKPMLVTLPCVFLLLDFWPLGRWSFARQSRALVLRPLVLEKIPFLLLSAAACLVALWTQSEARAVQNLANWPLGLRLGNACVSYARYAGHMFWPAGLALPYPPALSWPWETVAYAAALLAGTSAIALWLARKLPFLTMGWFWYLGTLVPVIGLVQVGDQAMADRYTYLPLIGLFLMLIWGAGVLLEKRPKLRSSAAIIAIALILACTALTRTQLRYWQNSEALFTHTLEVTKGNWLACVYLGNHLAEKERTNEAINLYRRALQIQPASTQALDHLGTTLAEIGGYGEALQCFERALRIKPENADLHSDYGSALDKAGQAMDAIAQYAQALQLEPDSALTHFRLGNSLGRLGRTEEAIGHYRLAVQYRPDFSEALNNLAVALFNQGKFSEAVEQFAEALSQNPNDANTRCNLANALAAAQRWNEAAEQYTEAVHLKPELLDARYGLARVLPQLGRRQDAIQQLTEVLRLQPGHVGAKQLLQTLQSAPLQ